MALLGLLDQLALLAQQDLRVLRAKALRLLELLQPLKICRQLEMLVMQFWLHLQIPFMFGVPHNAMD